MEQTFEPAVRIIVSKPNRSDMAESAALSSYEKAKALKTSYVNETDEREKNKIFNEIYKHERDAELFRRDAIRLRKNSN